MVCILITAYNPNLLVNLINNPSYTEGCASCFVDVQSNACYYPKRTISQFRSLNLRLGGQSDSARNNAGLSDRVGYLLKKSNNDSLTIVSSSQLKERCIFSDRTRVCIAVTNDCLRMTHNWRGAEPVGPTSNPSLANPRSLSCSIRPFSLYSNLGRIRPSSDSPLLLSLSFAIEKVPNLLTGRNPEPGRQILNFLKT